MLEYRTRARVADRHRTEMDAPWLQDLRLSHYQETIRTESGRKLTVIRSELNRRSEFQRVSCRLVAARMQMPMARSQGRKIGGRRRVGRTWCIGVDTFSECNHRNGTRVRRRLVSCATVEERFINFRSCRRCYSSMELRWDFRKIAFLIFHWDHSIIFIYKRYFQYSISHII